MENRDYKKTIELSDNVMKICNENYSKKCGVCGLRQKCVNSVGLGRQGFNEWILSVNKLCEIINKKMEA